MMYLHILVYLSLTLALLKTVDGSVMTKKNVNLLARSRQKRQTGRVCTREEKYSCPVESENISVRVCFRTVEYCCDQGYVMENGNCVPDDFARTTGITCGGYPTVMTQEAGQMSSPGHPGLYPNNFNCEWEIRGPEGSTIDVQITVLSIENPRYPCFFPGCVPICVDKLTITDGVSNWVLCGIQVIMPVFSSVGNSVRISFFTDSFTDSFYSYRGFQLSYTMRGIITTTTTTTTTMTTTTTTPATTDNNETSSLVTPNATPTTPPPRGLHILCLGDLVYTEFLPQCTLRCDEGVVVRDDCTPQDMDSRSGCVCPPEAPVSYRAKCITEIDCTTKHKPPTCFGGAIYNDCLPVCTLTCDNRNSLPDHCFNTSLPCVAGCGCPLIAPILDGESCIPPQLCRPKPQKTIIKCGKQFFLPNPRIVGGEHAVNGSWPWAVQIIKSILDSQLNQAEKFHCGGTVICSRWVLTAAHCFQNDIGFGFELQTYLYILRFGKHLRDLGLPTPGTNEQVPDKIFPHENYDFKTTTNDIALIRLKTPLQMTKTIRPACMPQYVAPSRHNSGWGPRPGQTCFAVGWGSTTGRGPRNTYLKEVRLSVRVVHLCESVYPNFHPHVSLCVGGLGTDDTCTGDSGGPLLCKHGDRWYVDGVTSYGLECGVVGQPSVYTRMTTFSAWVRSKTGQDCGHPDTEWIQLNN
ncbi:unnamed protein product [Clavelina lepadiformis]|uniref:Uncharacterized protein n=1 Tax=Clavelina lepadiformis TaxID=159417 RepID=A0ABP0EYK7_CLALP